MNSEKLTAIFEPLQLGNKVIRNRIASTPHTTGFGENGMPTERYARYHAEKAKGGAGLVMTFGSASVHPSSPPEGGGVSAWSDEVIPSLQRVSELVHEHGAVLISQISHRGRRSQSTVTERPLLAPSDIPEPTHREIPHEIEEHQIFEVIEAFGQAALRFKKGGFDGVEINSFGGQLIEQFWSPLMNTRTDAWGGSLENRMRFGEEVVKSVRQAVGSDFIVGFRLTGDELLEGGLGPSDMQEIARALDQLNLLDYFSVTGGVGAELLTQATTVASMDYPQMLYADVAANMKSAVSVPVLYAGRVVSPFQAEELITQGKVDIVGMTRAMIADPYLVQKATEGRFEDIRPCVGANEGCIGRRFSGLWVSCVHNPVTGREQELGTMTPATSGRKVVVVGGGPAGMEAARIAAERGHNVTLFEGSDRLGGQVLLAANAPHRQEYAGVARWLAGQVRKLVADMRMGEPATAEAVLDLQPDVVIVATGSTPRIPDIPGAELPHVTTVNAVLDGSASCGERVVVLDDDGHQRGTGVADYLSAQGKHVTVVTRLWSVGEDIDMTLKPVVYQRLLKQGVEMVPNVKPVEIRERSVRLRNVYSGSETTIDDVDTVVLAFGGKACDGLYRELKGRVPELHLVGDANAPRRLADAMLESTRVSRSV